MSNYGLGARISLLRALICPPGSLFSPSLPTKGSAIHISNGEGKSQLHSRCAEDFLHCKVIGPYPFFCRNQLSQGKLLVEIQALEPPPPSNTGARAHKFLARELGGGIKKPYCTEERGLQTGSLTGSDVLHCGHFLLTRLPSK